MAYNVKLFEKNDLWNYIMVAILQWSIPKY